jgi:Ca2+:H+ antiporter
MKYLNILLLFIPVTILGNLLNMNQGIIFIFSCLSIVPLAVIIGDSTEQIALFTGPKIGGLLNATMGNVPELLIGIFSVRAGLYSLVLASMAGSIMGNTLLVLGFSAFLGGLKYKTQSFSRTSAKSNFSLLFFAAVGMIIPFAFNYSIKGHAGAKQSITSLSFGIAVIMLSIYILGLVYTLITHRDFFVKHEEAENEEETLEKPKWSLKKSVIILAVTTFFVAIQSESLVGTVEQTVTQFGLPEIFIGIIIIPILGNVAEHASAMLMAVNNKIDISMEIAVGSSMQIALFVTPVLVLLSFFTGNPMPYVYSLFQIVSILVSIGTCIYMFQSGKTNWMEGVELVGCYCILGMAFFFL